MDQVGGMGPDCKWIIGGLAGFIVLAGAGAVAWIKAILKELSDSKDARIADMKENVAILREEDEDGK